MCLVTLAAFHILQATLAMESHLTVQTPNTSFLWDSDAQRRHRALATQAVPLGSLTSSSSLQSQVTVASACP